MSDNDVSVLFGSLAKNAETDTVPDHFHDLNLDQIVSTITSGREAYDLRPFFYQPLDDIESIHFRQEVFQDLMNEEALSAVNDFASGMKKVHFCLERVGKLYNMRQRQKWFLDAVAAYCSTLSAFHATLARIELGSQGLKSVRQYLNNYVSATDFKGTATQAASLNSDLSEIRYNLLIKANKITVSSYGGEIDYGIEVEETFSRFRKGMTKDYSVRFAFWPDMNIVEEKILEIVARMNPEVFSNLALFVAEHAGFFDETISRFEREIEFYLAYMDQMRELEQFGLEFCLPAIYLDQKFHISAGFDLALAHELAKEKRAVVTNDYALDGPGRVIVVSGPNSGGKTTYARAFGQVTYLASLGCPVPAREAQLMLCDRIFTHFEREEDLDNLRGKLEDELVRLRRILESATQRSVIIMNESFSSTALDDARALGAAILRQINELNATGICVTFVDELSRLGDWTVSMVAKVSPDDPTKRMFAIEPRPADGLAHALAIAEKYRLSYESVKGRISK